MLVGVGSSVTQIRSLWISYTSSIVCPSKGLFTVCNGKQRSRLFPNISKRVEVELHSLSN